MRNIKFFIIALATLSVVACNNSDPTQRAAVEDEEKLEETALKGTRLETDARFIKNYIQETLFSMTAAKIAADRAVNPEIRDFADTLLMDHRKLYNEAVKLAKDNKLPVPDETSEKLAKELDHLRNVDQIAFDEIYLQKVINYHQIVAAEADDLIKNSQLDPIIDFATRVKDQEFIHFSRIEELQQVLEA